MGPICVLFDLWCRWKFPDKLFHVLFKKVAFVEALLWLWVFVHLRYKLTDCTFYDFVIFSSHVLWICGSKIVDIQLKNLTEPVSHSVVRNDYFLPKICQSWTFSMASNHFGILLQLVFEISLLLIVLEIILNSSASEIDHGKGQWCSLLDVLHRHEVFNFTKFMPHAAILKNQI